MLLLRLAAGLLLLSSTNLPAKDKESPAPLDLGSRLELFVDGFLIESMEGLEQRLHHPVSAGKILTLDKPWEGITCDYQVVFKDGDLYRMYYRGSSHEGYTIPSFLKPGETVVPVHPQFALYAESPDGLTWTRPELGLVEFDGSKRNNIVLEGDGSHNLAPFRDQNPDATAPQRYKAVGSGVRDKKPVLYGFVSPDGLRWSKIREEPIITDGKFDSLNVAFWDTIRKEYVAIYRDFQHGVRTVKAATSSDFLNWSPGEWGQFGDVERDHLYTNATTPYFRAPQIYLAFPRRYIPWKTRLSESPWPGAADTVFMTSRDGVHWDRRFMESFIRPGRQRRAWMHRTNLASWGVVPTAPDEISLYVLRERDFPSVHFERMVLRTDGFVSIRAGYPGGELLTRLFTFDGGALVLNFSTSAAGSIRLELQDINGHPVPGFSLADSPLIFGDEIEHRVAWKRPTGQTDREPLKHLSGKPLRLRFVMKDADLYSIRFE